ncbi:integrase family protein (plasmid) [Gloeothece citriformis PCC 7424]|uniref:Integrase family protein n=1 Tax=Gloeothece citriformis (strain PCC 7424) TaxID=65393 RepID=B7KN12_GLOC7|nr:tyrosine-type recombinase/integrase [Gloeothece citriformis]ACK74184.1 integrase family protein [Gloeothece citriformis PCC 7424]
MNSITRATSDTEIILLWLNGKSKTTIISYQCHIKQFLEFVGKPLRDVTLDDLSLWVNRLNLTYQPVTVANKILTVKSLFSFACRVGYLTVNVGSFIKSPKLKDTLAERILEKAEVKRLINATPNERDSVLLSLMYGCGLRVSEVCGLNWSDLRNGKATVFGKGAKTRVVIIPPNLWDRLMQLPRDGEAVFMSRRGNRLERTYIHKMIKECCHKSGVSEKASSHWLRHSHASHAVEAGCNLRLLQQSLGHSKLETTEKYLHINPDEGSSQFIDI